MTRRTFPNEENRLVYGYTSAGAAFTSKAGATVTIYTDSACTALANIQDESSVAIPGSVLTIAADGRIPRFKGPDGTPYGTDTLYALVQGATAPGEPIYARYDDRLDTDTIIRCTSATRPSVPVDDQLIWETDTDRMLRYNSATSLWIPQGGTMPYFVARQNAATSITNNVDTTVIFQVEDADTDAQYNNATGLFTCSKAGLWLFTTTLLFVNNATGTRQAKLINSNSIQAQASAAAPTDGTGDVCTSMAFLMAVGQTMQVKAFQNSGGALNTQGNNSCLFSGVLLIGTP